MQDTDSTIGEMAAQVIECENYDRRCAAASSLLDCKDKTIAGVLSVEAILKILENRTPGEQKFRGSVWKLKEKLTKHYVRQLRDLLIPGDDRLSITLTVGYSYLELKLDHEGSAFSMVEYCLEKNILFFSQHFDLLELMLLHSHDVCNCAIEILRKLVDDDLCQFFKFLWFIRNKLPDNKFALCSIQKLVQKISVDRLAQHLKHFRWSEYHCILCLSQVHDHNSGALLIQHVDAIALLLDHENDSVKRIVVDILQKVVESGYVLSEKHVNSIIRALEHGSRCDAHRILIYHQLTPQQIQLLVSMMNVTKPRLYVFEITIGVLVFHGDKRTVCLYAMKILREFVDCVEKQRRAKLAKLRACIRLHLVQVCAAEVTKLRASHEKTKRMQADFENALMRKLRAEAKYRAADKLCPITNIGEEHDERWERVYKLLFCLEFLSPSLQEKVIRILLDANYTAVFSTHVSDMFAYLWHKHCTSSVTKNVIYKRLLEQISEVILCLDMCHFFQSAVEFLCEKVGPKEIGENIAHFVRFFNSRLCCSVYYRESLLEVLSRIDPRVFAGHQPTNSLRITDKSIKTQNIERPPFNRAVKFIFLMLSLGIIVMM